MGIIQGSIMGLIKGDTRNLDYSSYRDCNVGRPNIRAS